MSEILALQVISSEQSELDAQAESSISIGYCDEPSQVSLFLC